MKKFHSVNHAKLAGPDTVIIFYKGHWQPENLSIILFLPGHQCFRAFGVENSKERANFHDARQKCLALEADLAYIPDMHTNCTFLSIEFDGNFIQMGKNI